MSRDRVDQIYDLVTDLIRIVGNTNAMVEELREGQEELKRNQEKFQEGQARIESIVRQVQEDQKSIFEVLGEHEVAIRTLRRKPV